MSNIILPREPFQPGTVKPESDYEEFARLGAKLGLPCPQAHLSLKSLDSQGNLVDEYADRSRTPNRNYWNWLFRVFGALHCFGGSTGNNAFTSDATFGAGHMTVKTTAGVVQNTNVTTTGAPGGITDTGLSSLGVVCGTGTAAESFEDVALGARIANGTSAGQLSHVAMTQQTPTYNAGTLTWTALVIRIFNNNTAGTIVVGETGIYCTTGGNTGLVFMLMRDKLGSTVDVLAGGQLTVTYTFTLTFPA